MNRTLTHRALPLLLAALLPVAALVTPAGEAGAAKAMKNASPDAPAWTGPLSAPEFQKLNEGRIAAAKAAIAKMLSAKGPRTIENTLVPYDEASRQLDLAGAITSLMENVHPDSAIRATAEKLTQAVSAYGTEVSLDRRVYDALAALDLSGVDAETKFYVERELRDFRLAGVDKDEATRTKIKALRDELVKIGQDFDRNIREGVRTVQAKPEELAGLPADFVAARKPGENGLVTLDTNYPDYIPVMSYATNDALRKRFYMEFQNRAYPKNVEVLKTLITKRHELAGLLGYPNWADYITANKMVGTGKNVRDFIDRIVQASNEAQQRDYQILLRAKQQDDPSATAVEFWQQAFYSERVKKTDYDFDSQSIRPYLPYQQVKDGALGVFSRLFGVTFRRVTNGPRLWHESVEAYEILEGDRLIGRFYLDMHPRENKYNHAAQFDIRTGIAGRQLPEAALVCNLPGGEAGDPGLCEIDDVNTFFHEFGHLLHTLFGGHRKWVGTSGIRTEHDFVEAPSQMLEEWMQDPKTLQTFAKHYQTGEPVPTDLVLRMKRAEEYGKGLQVRRQMVYADLSLSIYNRDPKDVDFSPMMKGLVKGYQPFPYVDDTNFFCAFGHLDGYSAVYYTYMWSLVIAKDLFSAFDKSDLLNPAISMKYRRAVLEAGGSKPAAAMVEEFLGRPYNFEAYRQWLNTAP